MNRILRVSFLWLLLALCADGVLAQSVRPERTLFLRPHAGIASYVGDNNTSFLTFDGPFPYTLGLEFGYQYTVPFSMSVGYLAGNYPSISALGDPELRHTVQLFGRYLFGGSTGPGLYLQGGAHGTFGGDRPGFGPMAGLGLDIPLSSQVSLFLEGTTHASFPDDAVDGRSDNGGGSFDLLTSFNTGLKINFRSGVVAPDVRAINGPSRLQAGQEGTYTATVDERATQPVEYTWEWGDGSRSTGLVARHTYAQPGTYTVRFTATNRGGSDAESMVVTVTPAPVPASIVSITATPQAPDTQTPVQFTASVRGDQPITYRWDFGDGTTSTQAAPSHTYDREGTYTVTLEVSNAAGSDRRTTTVRVLPYTAEVCAEVISMNAVYFARNTSVLSAEARRSLEENVEILRECPNMNVRIEGHAAPGERQPQSLSEARARAVEAFYRERGITPGRMRVVGLGAASGTTSKKDGASQFQRVDTIPIR